MTVNIVCEIQPSYTFHYKKLAEKVIATALDLEEFPYEAEVSLTLVDNEIIHEINRETRQIDAPTDVLSFPMVEYAAPADYALLEKNWSGCMNPDSGEILLGDIILNLERVRSQAEEYGHTEKREYAFLITHSMLHLLGYDHMVPEEAAVMEEHQRKILDQLKITR